MEELESIGFVANVIHEWEQNNSLNSDSALLEIKKFLKSKVVDFKITNRDSFKQVQIKKIASFLCNGPNGKIMRLPNSTRERCWFLLNLFKNRSFEELLSIPEVINTNASNQKELIEKYVTEKIKKYNGACERLFIGMGDERKVKQSIYILACFDKISESEWYYLDEERVEPFEKLAKRGTMLYVITDEHQERYLVLKDHVKSLVSESDDLYKIIRNDLEVIYRHVKPILSTCENNESNSHLFMRNISLALDCFKSAAYLREFDVGYWSVSEITGLLNWINKTKLLDKNECLEFDSINKKSFEIFLLFFIRQTNEKPTYIRDMVGADNLNELIRGLANIVEYFSVFGNIRYIDLKVRAALSDIRSRLKTEINKYRYAYSYNDELGLFSDIPHNKNVPLNLSLIVEVFNSVTSLNDRLQKWNVISDNTQSNRIVTIDKNEKIELHSIVFHELSRLYSNRNLIDLEELNIKWHSLLQTLNSYQFSDTKEYIQVAKVLRKLSSSLASKNFQVAPNTITIQKCEGEILQPFLDLLSKKNIADDNEFNGVIAWYKARTLTYWILNIRSNHFNLSDSNLIEEWRSSLKLTGRFINYLGDGEFNKVISTLDVIQEIDPSEVNNIVIIIKEMPLAELKWPTCLITLTNMAKYVKELANTSISDEVYLLFSNYLLSIISYIDTQNINDKLKSHRKIRVLFSGLAFCKSVPKSHLCTEISNKIKRKYILEVIENLNNKILSNQNKREVLDSQNDLIRNAVEKFSLNVFEGDDEIFQEILQVLSLFNLDNSSCVTGDFVVVQVTEVDSSGVKLFIPNSNLEVKIANNLLPIQLYNAVTSEDGSPNFRDYWKGRFLLVSILYDRNQSPKIRKATARGAHYIGDCMHLFFPTSKNWKDTNPRSSRIDTVHEDQKIEWDGDLWLGASNSWAVMRSSAINKSLLLSNNGTLVKELQNNVYLRRITIFEKSKIVEDIDIRYFEQREIIQFTNDAYSDLDIFFGENDEVIFCNSKLFDSDPRKNRTFLSMFNKIFDLPASIYGTEEKV
ncbi:hypothetical protein [Pseudoalteromonas translucida]|uniref:hypothetical protein n=1 Tax=Pseudoalteromonas translucida TaxID=166935 RepID=UPI0012FDEA3E|nr:hypothetical protein [Pseudoalteromonas translucida]